MVRLSGLSLLLNVAIGLVDHSEAKQHSARGIDSASSAPYPVSLNVRDSLERGADPVELYRSIKVARAEAEASGRTIEVAEEDLRAILDKIEDLHEEVDGLLSGEASDAEAEDEAAGGGKNADDPKAAEPAEKNAKPAASKTETVSDPESSFDADSILDSVSFKQKLPNNMALDDEDAPSEDKDDKSSAAVPSSDSAVAISSTTLNESSSPKSTSQPQLVAGTPAVKAAAIVSSAPKESSSIPSTSQSQLVAGTPAVKAVVTSSATEEDEEEDEVELSTRTFTSTTTRTITLTTVRKGTASPQTTTGEASPSEAADPETPPPLGAVFKAIDDSAQEDEATTTQVDDQENTDKTTEPADKAPASTALEAEGTSPPEPNVKVAQSSSSVAPDISTTAATADQETPLASAPLTTSVATQPSSVVSASRPVVTPVEAAEAQVKAAISSEAVQAPETPTVDAAPISTSAQISEEPATELAVPTTPSNSPLPTPESPAEPVPTPSTSEPAPPVSTLDLDDVPTTVAEPSVLAEAAVLPESAGLNATLSGFRTVVRA